MTIFDILAVACLAIYLVLVGIALVIFRARAITRNRDRK